MDSEIPKNRITEDLLLVSTLEPPATLFQEGALHTTACKPKGSIYKQVMLNVDYLLKNGQDFEMMIHNLDDSKSIKTIQTVEAKSLSYGTALIRSGVQRGDKVCMLLGHGNTEVFYSSLGTWAIGAVVFFGDIRVGAKALTQQLSSIDCHYIISSDETSEFCDQVSKASEVDLKIIRVSRKESEAYEFLLRENKGDFNKLKLDGEKVELPDLDVENDLAVLAFTSGTTGLPKPLMHTHDSAWNITMAGFKNHFGSRSIGLSTVKIDTFVGMAFYIANLVESQSTIVIGLDEEDYEGLIYSAIEKFRPTSISLYCNYLVRLAEAEQLQPFAARGLLDTIRSISSMGSAVPLECEEKLRKYCPNLEALVCGFGSQESGCLTFTTTAKHLGVLSPLIEIKVVSLEDATKRLGPGEAGEICVRKPFMMKGYYNRPDETAKYFDAEGFGHIGDVVKYDDEGRIHFIERIKEMIKFNDFRVYPTIVEAQLQRHPAVRECLVYGKPNPKTMELPAALIVLKEGYTEEVENDIHEFLKNQVEDCNLIRGGILFCKKLPRNTMGKLMRREARAMAMKTSESNGKI